MKKLLTFASVAALAAGSALAADLPSRKAPPMLPPPPPPPMWTGFYAGLNAGYGFGTNSNTQSIGLASLPYSGYDSRGYLDCWKDRFLPGQGIYSWYDRWNASSTLGAGLAMSGVGNNSEQHGFIGGGQVGYNYQWGQSFVIGIEADIQGSGIRGNSNAFGLGSDSSYLGSNSWRDYYLQSTSWGSTRVNAGVDWMGTVRGRLGWLFTPTMLVFATGGLTYGGVYANVNNYAVASSNIVEKWGSSSSDSYGYSFNHTFVGGGNKSSTLVGWNVGGGLEWMFMPNWSLKAEAIYWNMGNMTLPTVAVATAPVSYYNAGSQADASPASAIGATRVNYQGVIARAGVNYHFSWFAPAPVVAKY